MRREIDLGRASQTNKGRCGGEEAIGRADGGSDAGSRSRSRARAEGHREWRLGYRPRRALG